MQVTSTQSGGVSVGGVSRQQPSKEDWAQRLSTSEGQKFLQVVADKTGISTADLKTQLEGGADLREILESKGVSRSEFREALDTAGVSPRGRAGGPPPGLPPAEDEQIEATILSTLSDALGISKEDLTEKLESGTTLQSLADGKGISQNDLFNMIDKALQGLFSSGVYGTDGAASSSSTTVSGTQVNQLV